MFNRRRAHTLKLMRFGPMLPPGAWPQKLYDRWM